MIKVSNAYQDDALEMRQSYVNTLMALAEENPKITVLDADLASSVGTTAFYKKFPDRAINCGIMEANACGVAAGLSRMGFVPFFHSFAVFSSRRICDQIFLSCAYAGLNVKIIGGDAGVSAAMNGGTHMAFEDFGVLRSIPGITLTEPTDAAMLQSLLPQIAGRYGVDYIRMPRKKVTQIYETGSEFTFGKAVTLTQGEDVSIIAGGMMVVEALKAAELLSKRGVRARVVDMFTIKPADEDAILSCARETGAIVTAENHNIIGGLGSAVAEVLAENVPVPLERVGVRDHFGEVGDIAYLKEKFGLTAQVIAEKALKALARKRA